MKYIDTKDGPVCPNCYHPALECRCEEGVDSNALFDSLKSERDKLILDLWGVFRRMSDIKPPEAMKLDDLELWTKVTEHRAVQDLLSNDKGHRP